jgi:hypothetical protein
MCPAELGVGLLGKAGMRFDKVFVGWFAIVHGFLPDLILITIAISLPGYCMLFFKEFILEVIAQGPRKLQGY